MEAEPSVMRDHQVLTRLSDTVSRGWEAWSAGPAASAATTGPATRPIPRPSVHGTGATASTPMSSAPPSATTVTTSIPLTQAAVAVERATMSVISRMRTQDQATAPVIDARVRPQTRPGTSKRLNRGLGDADCISRPHQPREVVSTPDDVKVDILAEVEAWVLVRAAKAGHVEIEDDHRRAAPADRLQQAHPIGVGARRDDRDGTPRQPADPLPRERLRQRRPAFCLGDREVIEDEPVLANRAVRFEDGAPGIVRDQAHLAAATVDLRCHRSGQADRVLDGRIFPFTEMHVPVEVQEDPQVGGQGLLECLRHEPAVLGGERPVNAAEAVARGVVANPTGLRRVVRPG